MLKSRQASIGKDATKAPRIAVIKSSKSPKAAAALQTASIAEAAVAKSTNDKEIGRKNNLDGALSSGREGSGSRLYINALKTVTTGQKRKEQSLTEAGALSTDRKGSANKRSRDQPEGIAAAGQSEDRNNQKRNAAKGYTTAASASAPPPPIPGPNMMAMAGMFGGMDPSMMAHQMNTYAAMMGFGSSADMMEFYSRNMLGMGTVPGGAPWPGPAQGRGRGPPRSRQLHTMLHTVQSLSSHFSCLLQGISWRQWSR